MNTLHIIVAGLGNPAPYQLTRHSVGNVLVGSLARRLNVQLSHSRGAGTGEATVQVGGGPVRVTLYKSDTFMNNSGPALARVLRSSGAPSNQLLVLHDALDRAPLSIAPKVRGSAEGHNGVRSAITSLGSDDFRRLRLGIGRSEQQDTAAFVLGALSAAERAHWGDGGRGVDEAWAAIEKVVAEIRGREQKRGARAAESSRTA